MNLEKFKKQFLNLSKNHSKHMNEKEYKAYQNKHTEYYKKTNEKELLIIPIEEMSELTQHLTKILRNKENIMDNFGLIEELADVQICIDNLKNYLEIDEDSFKYAIEVKTERNLKRFNNLKENPNYDNFIRERKYQIYKGE